MLHLQREFAAVAAIFYKRGLLLGHRSWEPAEEWIEWAYETAAEKEPIIAKRIKEAVETGMRKEKRIVGEMMEMMEMVREEGAMSGYEGPMSGYENV